MERAEARTIFVCSCEKSTRPDAGAVARARPGDRVIEVDNLCEGELGRFEAALAAGGPITVACTRRADVFADLAEEAESRAPLAFADIRESAGWSREGAETGPKIAALIAAASLPPTPTPTITLESRGVVLVLGRDDAAVAAAEKLADRMDVTVLIAAPRELAPPRSGDLPVFSGRVKSATGHLGAFRLVVDGFASPAASSRGALRFGPTRDGAVSECDIVLDLTGGRPLFPAHDLRDGYVRADPADRAAVAEALFTVSGLVGTFDKPRYVDFTASLCAHSRSRKTGCTRCLEVCPTGAITPAGDHVAIDAAICGGCGACTAVCPTGAAAYALPSHEAGATRLRALLGAYAAAGGRDAVVLFHDAEHGADLIAAAARWGDGLPARVLPVAVNEATQLGLESFTGALAWGASAVRVLTRAKPKHDIAPLQRTIALAERLATGLGYGAGRLGLIETDDPDALAAALAAVPRGGAAKPSAFLPLGDKRSVTRQAVRALREAAPAPVEVVPLETGAPFGRVVVDTAGCTLCLACVSACPTSALGDDPEKPRLTFSEDACVQCGLCAATCPEKVITLEPRMAFAAIGAAPITLKEEEPALCVSCGKAFGTKSTIERIRAKLADRHWMFADEGRKRLDLLGMCDTCRIATVTTSGFDPHAGPARPKPRTAEDLD